VDAVVFLGPRTHYYDTVPRKMVKVRETLKPHFYYFRFGPRYFARAEFPDTLHSLAKRLDGTVYDIRSPGDLARAVQKMLVQVPPGRTSAVDSR
jgi:hypothetical protein